MSSIFIQHYHQTRNNLKCYGVTGFGDLLTMWSMDVYQPIVPSVVGGTSGGDCRACLLLIYPLPPFKDMTSA